MTETIKYSLIGKEDIALRAVGGATNFSVTLPDGTVVVINRLALNDLVAFGAVNLNLQQIQNVLAEVRSANPTTQTQGRFWYISGVIRYSDGSTALELVELAATQTLTNKTLTSPRIGTAILDSSGNEIIETPATASAINHIKVTNAAAGGNVFLDAVGDDANVTLNIRPKGSGNVLIAGVVPSALPLQSGNVNKVLLTDGTSLSWATHGVKSVQVFTGSGTWTRPSGIARVLIESVGAGGGGGGADTAGANLSAAGGGGGGGTAKKLLDVTSIATSTITIGSAGTAGVADGGTGGTGGNTLWADGVNTVQGNGGAGGIGSGSAPGVSLPYKGGAGGTASGGDINLTGAAGHSGAAEVGINAMGGNGGTSAHGGGGLGGRAVAVGTDAGTDGGNYGGGGGGSANSATVAGVVGGAGAAGIVIVWEF